MFASVAQLCGIRGRVRVVRESEPASMLLTSAAVQFVIQFAA